MQSLSDADGLLDNAAGSSPDPSCVSARYVDTDGNVIFYLAQAQNAANAGNAGASAALTVADVTAALAAISANSR